MGNRQVLASVYFCRFILPSRAGTDLLFYYYFSEVAKNSKVRIDLLKKNVILFYGRKN